MKRRWKPVGLILCVWGISISILVACSTPSKAPALGSTSNKLSDTTVSVTSKGPVTIVGGDIATLQNFIEHWLSPIHLDMPNTQITVTIGALPRNLPVSLKVPSTMMVVGTFAQTGEYETTQLLLSTEQEAEAALAMINQQLKTQGFTKPESQQGATPGGFQPTVPAPYILCRTADDLAATLYSATSRAGLTDIRLTFTSFQPYGDPCLAPAVPDQGQTAILPILEAPTNAIVQNSSTRYGGDQADVSTEIAFAEDVATLTAHYDTQLVEAGWEQMEANVADNISWSAWTLVDDQENVWHITFYIVRQAAASDVYLATLRLRRAQ